jgi:hypothetical protein
MLVTVMAMMALVMFRHGAVDREIDILQSFRAAIRVVGD